MYLVHIHDITYARVRMQLKRWIIEKPEGNYNIQNGSTQQCPTTVTKILNVDCVFCIICLYLYCRLKSSNEEERVRTTLTD